MQLPLPLVKTIKQDETLTGFAQALSATGLGRRLSDAREVTVFAPSSAAWDNLGVVNDYLMLKEDTSMAALEAVTRYAIVNGVHYSADFKSGRTALLTSEGSELVVEKSGDTIYVGEGRLERSNQVGGLVTRKGMSAHAVRAALTVLCVTLPSQCASKQDV